MLTATRPFLAGRARLGSSRRPPGAAVAGCPPGCVLGLPARGHSLPLHDCGFWSHHGPSSWPLHCYCGAEGHLVMCALKS